MINLIKPDNLQAINEAANAIVSHLKTNKIYFVRRDSEYRALASQELYNFTRAIAKEKFCDTLKGDDKALAELNELVSNLTALLGERRDFRVYKLSDYSKPDVLLKKMSRDIASYLADLYVMGEVTQADIEQVYANIGKPVAKKFKFISLKGESKKLYSLLSQEIRGESAEIKAATTKHYEAMVSKIDPSNSAQTPKEFLELAFKKLSDIDASRMCMALRFDEDKFQEMIEYSFEMNIAYAAIRIIEHCDISDSPSISVNSVKVGGKGFDVSVNVGGKTLNARAIPVEGFFVRFHYRYIIT